MSVTCPNGATLAIEARNVDGKPAWYWGVARMSMVNLRAEHKGTEVWTADWVSDLSAPNKGARNVNLWVAVVGHFG